MDKKYFYIFGIISVFIFSLISFFYYAFSGGSQTQEFFTGLLLLTASAFSIIALFLIKKHIRTAGIIFILSSVLSFITISVYIGNPIFIFMESPVGLILTALPVFFLILGFFALNIKKEGRRQI